MNHDLKSLVTSRLGLPDRCGKWRCPFHDDHNPSLGLLDRCRDGRVRIKCWSCGWRGDAADFVMALDDCSFMQARRYCYISSSQGPAKQARVAPLPAASVAAVEAGRRRIGVLREYLADRGLSRLTTWRAKLGCDGSGLLIPWYWKRRLVAVNVRQFDGHPKYRFWRGSRRAPWYPDVRLTTAQPVLLCEGELDTLLARQELGDVVQAITLGSAADRLQDVVLRPLQGVKVICAFDGDEAGDAAWRRLADAVPHARRLRLPRGRDLSDMHRILGLRKWFLSKEI